MKMTIMMINFNYYLMIIANFNAIFINFVYLLLNSLIFSTFTIFVLINLLHCRFLVIFINHHYWVYLKWFFFVYQDFLLLFMDLYLDLMLISFFIWTLLLHLDDNDMLLHFYIHMYNDHILNNVDIELYLIFIILISFFKIFISFFRVKKC